LIIESWTEWAGWWGGLSVRNLLLLSFVLKSSVFPFSPRSAAAREQAATKQGKVFDVT